MIQTHFPEFLINGRQIFSVYSLLVSCERACGDLVTEAGLASAAGD